MSKNRRQNVERTKVMALIAALLLGGALVYMACTNSEEVTVEYNGVTYTAQEYNRLMAEQYRLQSEEEARQNLSGGGKNSKFLTLIDDDGYNSFTEKLLPVMKEKNVSISMAIETGKAGTGDFMSWETIAENHAAGAEVLNHSRWHIYSAEESEKRDRQAVKEEMIGSIQDLIDHGYADTADIYIYPGASAGSTWFIAQEVFRVGINSSGSVVNQPPFQQYNMRRYPIGSTHVPDFWNLHEQHIRLSGIRFHIKFDPEIIL